MDKIIPNPAETYPAGRPTPHSALLAELEACTIVNCKRSQARVSRVEGTFLKTREYCRIAFKAAAGGTKQSAI